MPCDGNIRSQSRNHLEEISESLLSDRNKQTEKTHLTTRFFANKHEWKKLLHFYRKLVEDFHVASECKTAILASGKTHETSYCWKICCKQFLF